MANVISNVMGYKVVANNGFQFNVNVNGVNNLGNRKWMLRAVEVIRDYFTFTDGADEGLIVNVVVNTHEIIVKAEFNGKKYFALPIQPRYGKNQIKDILDNMGVVKDVIDVYTNNMVNSNNNMEENNMNDMANSVEMFNEFIKDMLLNEYNDVVNSADNFAHDLGDECVDDEYVCGRMIYDYDIRKMWADWCWKNDVMNHNDAYKYYDDNNDMFICEDTLDDIVEGLDGTDDVGYGECLVWVKNPYYVDKDVVKNDTPCLDEYDEDEYDDNEWSDRDLLIKNTADTIKDYLGNYMPSYLDQFGDCVITVYWDEFTEDMMKNMIEDDNFAMSVRDSLYRRGLFEKLSDFLVYDDGVYVTVDYDKMFNKVA